MTFEDIIENIEKIKCLFEKIPSNEKRLALNRYFHKHLEGFVIKMEEAYYKKIILNRSVKRILSSQEAEIEKTYNTMQAFLPFLIAFNDPSPS